jgi:3-hydroxybutyryl-CoA dehydrogenase
MNNIGIIGAGIMGSDLAHLIAGAGYNVKLFDIDITQTTSAINNIYLKLNEYVEKGRIANTDSERIKSKISIAKNIEELSDSDIFLEAVKVGHIHLHMAKG